MIEWSISQSDGSASEGGIDRFYGECYTVL